MPNPSIISMASHNCHTWKVEFPSSSSRSYCFRVRCPPSVFDAPFELFIRRCPPKHSCQQDKMASSTQKKEGAACPVPRAAQRFLPTQRVTPHRWLPLAADAATSTADDEAFRGLFDSNLSFPAVTGASQQCSHRTSWHLRRDACQPHAKWARRFLAGAPRCSREAVHCTWLACGAFGAYRHPRAASSESS